MTPWYLPVALRVLVANGAFPFVLKGTVGFRGRPLRFFLQFLFCFLIAGGIAAALGQLELTRTTAAIFAIGVASGVGAFAQWRAVSISLSRTSLFTFLDDLIAMGLSLVVLREARHLTPLLGLGITLALGSVMLFAVHSYGPRACSEATEHRRALFLNILTYSVIWGFAMFSLRYFGVRNIPTATFLTAWYAGTSVTALAALLLRLPKEAGNLAQPKHGNAVIAFTLAVFIGASLALQYWSYRLAPQTVVQPLYLIGEMALPTAIGLFAFGERKHLDAAQKVYFALALVGGTIIALGFRP
jgi:hypothetical protein